jgi:chemotaxis protein methyltransferase CheR
MLLKEHFPDVCGWPPTIFATDLSKPVLERAKAGLFQQMEVNRGLPAQLLIKHFERTGTQWQLKEDLRRMVQFAPLNLLDPFPPTLRPDIVLLRNVLIYFSTETKRDILRRVRSVIAPDGWLLLGAAEAAHTVEDGWEVHTIDRTIWNRPRRSTP